MKNLFLNLLTAAVIIAAMFFLAMPAKAQRGQKARDKAQNEAINKLAEALNAQAENAKVQAEAIKNLQTQMRGQEEKIDKKLAEVMEVIVAKLAEMKPAEEPASAKTGTTATGKPEANTATKSKPAVLLKIGQVKYDSNTKEAVYLPGDTLAANNIRVGFTKKEDKDATKSLKKGQFLEDYSSKEYYRLASDEGVEKNNPSPFGGKAREVPR